MFFLKQYLVDLINIYRLGKKVYLDDFFKQTAHLSNLENLKTPRRSDVINFLIAQIEAQNYLEIGVRNPQKNFDKIQCGNKFSVDPGIEFEANPVDFKMTSDVFFEKLKKDELNLSSKIKFDVIFIDGLHISTQVERDILNSLKFLSDKGFIILHDCNPPSEFHQREEYNFINSPARTFWNGTTWKAFYKFRHRDELFSICFDCDWGVGVFSKMEYPYFNNIKGGVENEFYEFSIFNEFRREHLNLHSFQSWKESLSNEFENLN